MRFSALFCVFAFSCSSLLAAPLIVTQPESLTTNVGSDAIFSVLTTGLGTITYQWQSNGVPITGATNSSYTVASLTTKKVGAYKVAVSDLTGSSTSILAIVTAKPVIPATIFDVTTYGAVADNSTDNASAINTAISAANTAGGGVVRVPAAAQPYLAGRLTLLSNVKLQVDTGATLQPLPYGRYPTNMPSNRFDDWLIASHAHDIEICGGGTIDGNGQAWWDQFFISNSMPHRPYLIKLSNCQTVYLHDITLHNSPMFHFVPDTSTNVTIDHVTITASGVHAANTDATDPSGVNILIQNSNISVDDDNVAVKAGNTFCRNIVITHCAMGTGHGISVGGQSNAGLDDMLVSHCTMTGTTSGFRLKADASQGGPVKNIYYTDVQMTNVQYPIVFYSYYREVGNPGNTAVTGSTSPTTYNATPPDPLLGTTFPTWKNITVDNVSAVGATGGSIIWGIPVNTQTNGFFSGVRLNNVSLNNGSGSFSILRLYNVYDVQLTGTNKIATFTTYNAMASRFSPMNVTNGVGDSTGFFVTTVGTSGVATVSNPTYQWYREGVALANGAQSDGTVLSGVTSASLGLSSVKLTAAGHYTCLISNSLDAYNTVSHALVAKSAPLTMISPPVSLVVTQSFAGWATSYGLTGPDADPTADPDGDGIGNYAEFELGLTPTNQDASAFPKLIKTNGQYVFRVTEQNYANPANYAVQSSSNLVDWTAVTPIVESFTTTNQTAKATFPADWEELFVRLQFIGP